jgi:hypothetical protein
MAAAELPPQPPLQVLPVYYGSDPCYGGYGYGDGGSSVPYFHGHPLAGW